MQTQFGMQRTLDGEMQADTAPIDAAMAAAKKEKEAMTQRRQREQARQSVADAEGQQALKSFCDCEHCRLRLSRCDIQNKRCGHLYKDYYRQMNHILHMVCAVQTRLSCEPIEWDVSP